MTCTVRAGSPLGSSTCVQCGTLFIEMVVSMLGSCWHKVAGMRVGSLLGFTSITRGDSPLWSNVLLSTRRCFVGEVEPSLLGSGLQG